MAEEQALTREGSRRKRESWRLFYIGTGLVLLGLIMPALITVESVGLYDTLMAGIYQDQEV